MNRISRRRFMKNVATVGGAMFAGPYILRAASGTPLRMAYIGTGGRGGGHLRMGDVAVAFAEVDTGRWPTQSKDQGTRDRFASATCYTDFRKMFDKHGKDIDAVVVSTPDHTHAAAAMMALRLGKGCYCEKPLTWSIEEARAMEIITREKKLPTQMGNQGHANLGNRRVVEWIRRGGIGEVTEVHTWTNRPVWPQGVQKRPATKPVPANLDWDNWIGPAEMRDFHDGLHSFGWRGYYDFGCGAVGDMGCHTWDCVFWAMDPDYPTSTELLRIEGSSTETFPSRSAFKWIFPAKGARRAFDAYWYSGGWKPQLPAFMEVLRKERGADASLSGSGSVFIGTKGYLYVQGDYGDSPRIVPEADMKAYTEANQGKPALIPPSPGHAQEFIMACKGERPWDFPGSNFANYAAQITEVMLLGAICERIGQVGFKIETDPVKREIRTKEALPFRGRPYRAGWTL
jgi:predicted dehydrogenase